MNLLGNNPITADEDYVIENIVPGRKYLMCLKGSFGGGTVTMKYLDPVQPHLEVAIDNGILDGTITELDFVLPTNQLILIVADCVAPSISISITPYL